MPHIPRSVPPSSNEPERPPIQLSPPPPPEKRPHKRTSVGLTKLDMHAYQPDQHTLIATLLGEETANALTRRT